MNVALKVHAPPGTAEIKHSVLAYARATEELGLELPVPLFLDTLALKIAGVPPEDKYGALSYPLDGRAVEALRFLLGLQVDLQRWEYFLESTGGVVSGVPSRKLDALRLMTELTPHPRYVRSETPRFSERELVLPTLRLLDQSDHGRLTAGELIGCLTTLFAPAGQGSDISEGRDSGYFSRKVRSMISHRNQPSSFIHRGLARYERQGLTVSNLGRATVQALTA